MGKQVRMTELEAQLALTAFLVRCGQLAGTFILATEDAGDRICLESQVACFLEARETLDQAEALLYAVLLATGETWESVQTLKPDSKYTKGMIWRSKKYPVSRQAIHKRLKKLSDEVLAKAQSEIYSDSVVWWMAEKDREKIVTLLTSRLEAWYLPYAYYHPQILNTPLKNYK